MTTTRRNLFLGAAALATLTAVQTASAHAGHDHGEGFAGSLLHGLQHPVFGLDHLLAMIASGLIAVRVQDRRALWIVPLTFVVLMIAGGLLAFAGVPLPGAEWGIALSVIVFGVLVAAMPKAPSWVGATIVGLFAICHGHAHVAELGGAALLPYTLGFATSTLALHAAAIAIGLGLTRAGDALAVRAAGAAIAATFCVVLVVA